MGVKRTMSLRVGLRVGVRLRVKKKIKKLGTKKWYGLKKEKENGVAKKKTKKEKQKKL